MASQRHRTPSIAPQPVTQKTLQPSAQSKQYWRNQPQGNWEDRPIGEVDAPEPYKPADPTFRGLSQEWMAAGMVIQPKLTIGAPNDKYEQEADRVAEQVVQRLHSPQLDHSQSGETVQREVEPDEEDELQMKPLLQRHGGGAIAASNELATAIQQSRGGGQPLTDSIRKPMEQAFGGVDFSGVKVHTDERSDTLNRSIQSKAFTTRQDIYFRQGAYEPGSRGGQELIAHELTHVVQQTAPHKNIRSHNNEREMISTSPTLKLQRKVFIYDGDYPEQVPWPGDPATDKIYELIKELRQREEVTLLRYLMSALGSPSRHIHLMYFSILSLADAYRKDTQPDNEPNHVPDGRKEESETTTESTAVEERNEAGKDREGTHLSQAALNIAALILLLYLIAIKTIQTILADQRAKTAKASVRDSGGTDVSWTDTYTALAGIQADLNELRSPVKPFLKGLKFGLDPRPMPIADKYLPGAMNKGVSYALFAMLSTRSDIEDLIGAVIKETMAELGITPPDDLTVAAVKLLLGEIILTMTRARNRTAGGFVLGSALYAIGTSPIPILNSPTWLLQKPWDMYHIMNDMGRLETLFTESQNVFISRLGKKFEQQIKVRIKVSMKKPMPKWKLTGSGKPRLGKWW